MDILEDLPTQRDVREALKSLPEGREETYLQAWNSVNAQIARKRELGKDVLLWIVNAQRPLRQVELQHALAIREDDDEFVHHGLCQYIHNHNFLRWARYR